MNTSHYDISQRSYAGADSRPGLPGLQPRSRPNNAGSRYSAAQFASRLVATGFQCSAAAARRRAHPDQTPEPTAAQPQFADLQAAAQLAVGLLPTCRPAAAARRHRPAPTRPGRQRQARLQWRPAAQAARRDRAQSSGLVGSGQWPPPGASRLQAKPRRRADRAKQSGD